MQWFGLEYYGLFSTWRLNSWNLLLIKVTNFYAKNSIEPTYSSATEQRFTISAIVWPLTKEISVWLIGLKFYRQFSNIYRSRLRENWQFCQFLRGSSRLESNAYNLCKTATNIYTSNVRTSITKYIIKPHFLSPIISQFYYFICSERHRQKSTMSFSLVFKSSWYTCFCVLEFFSWCS